MDDKECSKWDRGQMGQGTVPCPIKQVASKMSHASGAGRSEHATTTVTKSTAKVATNNPNKTNN